MILTVQDSAHAAVAPANEPPTDPCTKPGTVCVYVPATLKRAPWGELEPNNIFAEATPILFNTMYIGELDAEINGDFYVMSLTTGEAITIEMAVENGNNDGVQILLYDENESLITYDPIPPFELSHTAGADGAYYLRVTTTISQNLSLYHFKVSKQP
jgi:hypothetical protein